MRGDWMLASDEATRLFLPKLMDLQGVTGPAKAVATSNPGKLRIAIRDDSVAIGRASILGCPYLLDGQWHQSITVSSAARYGTAQYRCEEWTPERLVVTTVLAHESATPTKWVFSLNPGGYSCKFVVSKGGCELKACLVRTYPVEERWSHADPPAQPRRNRSRCGRCSLSALPESTPCRSMMPAMDSAQHSAKSPSVSSARSPSSSPASTGSSIAHRVSTSSLGRGLRFLVGLAHNTGDAKSSRCAAGDKAGFGQSCGGDVSHGCRSRISSGDCSLSAAGRSRSTSVGSSDGSCCSRGSGSRGSSRSSASSRGRAAGLGAKA